jgi:hypothetical protein
LKLTAAIVAVVVVLSAGVLAGSGRAQAARGQGGATRSCAMMGPADGRVPPMRRCEAGADAAGNLVIADTGNNRIQVVAVTTGTFYGQAMTAGDVYTVAGNGIAGYSGDGGPAVAAELGGPEGVAVDAKGNLVIADTDNSVIRVVADRKGTFYGQAMTAGDIYTVAGQPTAGSGRRGVPAASARLGYPGSVAVDARGNLVIADTYDSVVRVLAESTGTFYGQAMKAGHLYTVAGDGTAGYGGDGGPATAAELYYPGGARPDAAGNLLIADTNNNRIRVVADSTGTFYGQVMTAGDIYTVAGNGTAGYGGDGGPATAAQMSYPKSVAADAAGNLVIADAGNNRIRVVATRTGRFYGRAMTARDMYTVAGTGTPGDTGDGGLGTKATVSVPQAVAVDAAGNPLITDTGNSSIRALAGKTGTFYGQKMVTGHIYTVAGSGTPGDKGDGGPATSAEFYNPESGPTLNAGTGPVFTSADTATFTGGKKGKFTLSAYGATPVSFTETGALPPGVKLSSTGVLSGTPTGNGGSYALSVAATNAGGNSSSQALILEVVKACTTQTTSQVVVPANTPTDVNVKALPSCAPLISASSPVDVGADFAAAQSAGADTLQVTSSKRLTVTPGEVVNFRPVVPGTLTCTKFTGTIDFSPPLRNNMTGRPEEILQGTASGCTSSVETIVNGVVRIHKFPWRAFFMFALEVGIGVGGGGLATIAAGALSLLGAGIIQPPKGNNVDSGPSVGTFPATQITTGPKGLLEFVFTSTAGTPSVMGSFAGSDSGASSSGVFMTSETPSELNKEGGSAKGISSIKIVSGSFTLG